MTSEIGQFSNAWLAQRAAKHVARRRPGHDRRQTSGEQDLYALMGGLAVRLHAIPRTTNDVDLMISVSSGDLPNLIRTLVNDGFEVAEAFQQGRLDSVAEMPLFKIKRYHGDRIFDLDLFIAETPFQESLMARRQVAESLPGKFFFAAAEDMVILKIMSGRARDLIDAHDILFTMGQLDEAYLKIWAEALGLENRLSEAMRDL